MENDNEHREKCNNQYESDFYETRQKDKQLKKPPITTTEFFNGIREDYGSDEAFSWLNFHNKKFNE